MPDYIELPPCSGSYMASDPAELDDELEELESIGTMLMDVASYDDYFVDYN